MAVGMNNFNIGFDSQTSELDNQSLEVIGTIPDWLRGSLYRNGPALYKVGEHSVNHWFDGFGMLHRFFIQNGNVTYSNRFIESRGYQAAIEEKRIKYHLFATAPDYTWWQKIISWFQEPVFSYNTNVNIAMYGDQLVSMTEKSAYNTHDLSSLATNDPIDLNHIGEVTTAHPHFDYDTSEFINFCIKFGPKSTYRFFSKGVDNAEPRVFAEYETVLPSYVHSFGLTSDFVILLLSPLKVNPLKLRFGNKPYYECYRWYEDHDTKLVVLSRLDGSLIKEVDIDTCFIFHFVNCYQEDNQIIVDYCAADNAQRINHFYLNKIKAEDLGSMQIRSRLKRTILTTDGKEVDTTDTGIYFEMPTINYKYYNSYRYQYAYGLSYHGNSENIENALIKVDMNDLTTREWYQANMYPQEGIFVPNPDSIAEDDGVILTVVLDTKKRDSFLLVLNANDLSELARVYVGQIVPFGFHGTFMKS